MSKSALMRTNKVYSVIYDFTCQQIDETQMWLATAHVNFINENLSPRSYNGDWMTSREEARNSAENAALQSVAMAKSPSSKPALPTISVNAINHIRQRNGFSALPQRRESEMNKLLHAAIIGEILKF